MRALKIAGAAIGAVVVIAALLLVIGIPSGFMTQQIQERVERETGYKLTINGSTKIGLWPSSTATSPKTSPEPMKFRVRRLPSEAPVSIRIWPRRTP